MKPISPTMLPVNANTNTNNLNESFNSIGSNGSSDANTSMESTDISPNKESDIINQELTETELSLIPTQRHFYSEILSQLQCVDCHYHHDQIIEPYTNIGVDLEFDLDNNNSNSKTYNSRDLNQSSLELEDLLTHFFAPEIRELECESCHKLNGTVKLSKSLKLLPQVYIIQLKRFKYDRTINNTVKIHRSVTFPKVLDMSKFCINNDSNNIEATSYVEKYIPLNSLPQDIFTNELNVNDSITTPIKSILNDCNNNDIMKSPTIGSVERNKAIYYLTAVIRHQGRGSASGHYICDKLDETNQINNSNNMKSFHKSTIWKRCNDSVVSEITEVSQKY